MTADHATLRGFGLVFRGLSEDGVEMWEGAAMGSTDEKSQANLRNDSEGSERDERADVLSYLRTRLEFYSPDVWPEPPRGEHGQTVDACSARAIRFVLGSCIDMIAMGTHVSRDPGMFMDHTDSPNSTPPALAELAKRNYQRVNVQRREAVQATSQENQNVMSEVKDWDADDWAEAMLYAESGEAKGLQDYRRDAVVALARAFAGVRRGAVRDFVLLGKDLPRRAATEEERAVFAEHKRKLETGETKMISHEERQRLRRERDQISVPSGIGGRARGASVVAEPARRQGDPPHKNDPDQVDSPLSSRARLDADGTAKPLTEIVGVFPEGDGRTRTVHLGQATHYVARPTDFGGPALDGLPDGAPLGDVARRGSLPHQASGDRHTSTLGGGSEEPSTISSPKASVASVCIRTDCYEVHLGRELIATTWSSDIAKKIAALFTSTDSVGPAK